MGVPITGKFTRGANDTGQFLLVDASGSVLDYRRVATTTERDTLEEYLRRSYMLIYVISEAKTYRLGSDTTIAGQVWTEESGSFIPLTQKGAASGVVPLNSSGKIDIGYLDTITLSASFAVADIAAMLALITYTGNIIVVADASADPSVTSGSASYVKANDVAVPVIGDFLKLEFGTSVTSVNGEVGAIDQDFDFLLAYGSSAVQFAAAVATDTTVLALAGAVALNTVDITTLDTNKADVSNVLELDNITAYSPTTAYHPSTKKYVDDTVTAIGALTSPLTTKGDLWGFDVDNNRVPIGTDGYILTADSTQALGLKWAAPFSPTTLLADYSFTDNSSNWNTAYGWGDHSGAGYLTSLAFAGLSDYPVDAAGVLTNDGAGNLSWAAGGGSPTYLREGSLNLDSPSLAADSSFEAGVGFAQPSAGEWETILYGYDGVATNEGLRVDKDGNGIFASTIQGSLPDAAALLNESPNSTNPTIVPDRSNTNTGIGSQASSLWLIASGVAISSLSAFQINLYKKTVISGSLTLSGGAGYIQLSDVLTGDPAGSDGMLYYNSLSNKFRAYENGAWADMIGDGTPGGLTGNIQYNNGGVLDGFGTISGSNIELDKDTLYIGRTSGAPDTASKKIYAGGTGTNSLYIGPKSFGNLYLESDSAGDGGLKINFQKTEHQFAALANPSPEYSFIGNRGSYASAAASVVTDNIGKISFKGLDTGLAIREGAYIQATVNTVTASDVTASLEIYADEAIVITSTKLGFFGATAVIQPSHIADPTGGATIDAEARTAINSILSQMATLGLQAAS